MSPLKIISSLRACFSYGPRPNPSRDWRVLLAIFLLAFFAIVLGNWWMFGVIVSGGTLGNATSSPTSTVSDTSVDTARALIESRATEDMKYASGTYSFPDPSATSSPSQ